MAISQRVLKAALARRRFNAGRWFGRALHHDDVGICGNDDDISDGGGDDEDDGKANDGADADNAYDDNAVHVWMTMVLECLSDDCGKCGD
eukprot:8904028-Pyramimonas_sp.AAC.1